MTFLLLALLAVLAYFAVNSSAGNSVASSVETIVEGNLTPAQIADYAINAGFVGDDLTTAIAVALAESGGDPNAYNPETAAGAPEGQGSYGLWQIYLHAHPEFNGTNLYEPQQNANAAFSIYLAAGSQFRPWSTYTGGAYATFIQAASQGIADAGSVA